MTKLRCYALREKTDEELLKLLDEMKRELAQLRVAKAAGTGACKLGKIRLVRKNIFRILLVHTQRQKAALREKYKKSKRIPKELRPKLTKKLRMQLTPEQKQKKIKHRPRRKYALMA